MPNERKKPVHEIRIGRIKAAIWQHEVENRKFFSTTIIRLYKDGKYWKDSTSFDRDDLPLVAKVADRVHSWIFEQMQDCSVSHTPEPSNSSNQEF
jgi:hypothetical protein